MTEERRCPQCYQMRQWPAEFIGKRGRPVNFCATCQDRYGNWAGKTLAEKLSARGKRKDPRPTGRMLFTRSSKNTKTGPIPVSISERGTCPTSCSLYDAGCYASYGKLGGHWKGVGTAARAWMPYKEFLARVRQLPEGQLWRHNEAGDLAGRGGALDVGKLRALVAANRGRRGFTFTHKTGAAHLPLYQWAALEGFVVNLSADSLEQADALLDRQPPGEHPMPTAVLLPEDAPDKGIRTPKGRRVVVCPAQTSGLTCAECELCAHPFRHSIVGFKAHGQSAALVPAIVRRRLPLTLDRGLTQEP